MPGRFKLLFVCICWSFASAQAPLPRYLPLKQDELLTYHIKKADEPAVRYVLTLTVKQAEAMAPGEVFSIVVLDGSDPKPKPRRLDLYVDREQITDMSGPALLRAPLQRGASWSSPAWAGKRSHGEYLTSVVSLGRCRVGARAFSDCVITRESNPLDRSVTVRTFVADTGLAKIELFSSESRYRQGRPLRTETLTSLEK